MKKILSTLILLTSLISCAQTRNGTQTTSNIDTVRIKKDLLRITKTQNSRNYKNIKTLNSIASYIKVELAKVCDTTAYQEYKAKNETYKNVLASIGTEHKERLIIGAHYDVYGNQEGADDNASGVAGLLELARLLSKEKLDYRIDFVAYTLEEPPFFRTEKMGSYVHANYLKKNNITVKGMICLEMIGYYKDEPNTQTYPIKEMSTIYGNRANFITVVQNEKSGNFGAKIENLMKKQKLIPTVSFKGSSLVTGVDFSDHLNYWNLNYPAVMITNTSFYRNKNYHTNKDSLETLNINKMSAVIQQLYITIKEL
ncbi:MAG: M28 family peptidase [Cellulophaga sp.]|uniref:M28 family peptidase n=1 Tax=Cellulophaga sp. TaxID=1972202 RepID=UPI003267987E